MSDMLQLVVKMADSQCATLRVISLLESCQPPRKADEACRTLVCTLKIRALVLLNPVLVNHTALHHKYDAAHGCDVCQRIAIKRDDVCLQTGRDGTDLIGHVERFRRQVICG